MPSYRSHFTFTKKQRNGIFLLVIIIVILQIAIGTIDPPVEDVSIDPEILAMFNQEMDSLRKLELQERKPKIYPFNPNFITDHKGYSLGMSVEEIDRFEPMFSN